MAEKRGTEPRRARWASAAALVLLATGACNPRTSDELLTIKGSDTMVQLAQRWAEIYMDQHPEIIVQVTGGGSGTGIASLINGSTHIALASRTMSAEEAEIAREMRGAAVREIPVALDALAIYLNTGNPVESLTVDQLSRIFRGEVTRWSEVGGPAEPIVLYGRENSSGTYVYFKERVMGNADFPPVYQALPGTAAVINAVAQDPWGIGYGGIGYLAGIKTIGVRPTAEAPPVDPTLANVLSNAYPLSRNLYFYTIGEPQRLMGDFVAWTLSPEGQTIVSASGYYPLRTGAEAP